MANCIDLLPPRDLLPVGFRFYPTEEELISHYLMNKVLGKESLVDYIRQIDTCKYEPWDLPGLLNDDTGYEKWFFFSALDFKYSNSHRSNRTTKSGFWKSTGKDREIMARVTNQLIGTKKNLVFYSGRGSKAIRTNWVIHEYRLHSATNSTPLRPFVICRLKLKADKNVLTFDEAAPNGFVNSKSEIVSTRNGIQEIQPNFQDLDYDFSHLQSVPDFHPSDRGVNSQLVQPEATEDYFDPSEILGLLRSPQQPASPYFQSIIASDEYFDDAISRMCRPFPSRFEPEPDLMDFQPANGNNGEVNNQRLRLGASESEINLENYLTSVLENENNDEVTSAIRIDGHSIEEPSNTLCANQYSGFSSDTYNDGISLMDLAYWQQVKNDHIAPSSCSSAMSNSLTIKESRRGPLPAKRFQYREEKEMNPPKVLQGSFVSCSKKKVLRGSSCGSITSTSDVFSRIITTKRIEHKSSHSLVYFAKAFLGAILFVVLLYSHHC